jgi:hypothetical protein
MHSDFEPPKLLWSILAAVGGVAAAAIAIVQIEMLSIRLHQAADLEASQAKSAKPAPTPPPVYATSSAESQLLAKLDGESLSTPGTEVDSAELIAKQPKPSPQAKVLNAKEREMAKQAWQYFQRNWNDNTGLVNSANNFASVTLWDQGAAIAALVSARELKLISTTEFDGKMERMLKTLGSLQLYRGKLPNKVYNSKTLLPVNYGKLKERAEIGWSAIDLGRMAIWLKIVASRYPQFAPQVKAVWQHWQTQHLVKDGQMYGTSVVNGEEEYNQEGRMGYENYAAYGLKLWGLKVDRALNTTKSQVAFVNLYGQGVPYDRRDAANSEANNYVLSEPFILDGIETGFRSLPKAYADRVLAAQEARYKATKQLTAVTEDNLDRAPYFVYSTLFVNGMPWATISDKRAVRNDLRFLSAKASIGWYVLYDTDYTKKLFNFVHTNLNSDRGWYNGFYESLKEPNKALTANNNGVILQSLLYKQVGQPLIDWAGVKPSP